MKITIKCDQDTIILDNESLDNDNFVDLTANIDGISSSITVDVDDLLSAIKTFHQLRSLRLEREQYYE